jgi:hypothetical protein
VAAWNFGIFSVFLIIRCGKYFYNLNCVKLLRNSDKITFFYSICGVKRIPSDNFDLHHCNWSIKNNSIIFLFCLVSINARIFNRLWSVQERVFYVIYWGDWEALEVFEKRVCNTLDTADWLSPVYRSVYNDYYFFK